MKTTIRTFCTMRERIRGLAEAVPADQALVVPDGFANNIAWNICHLVVTQQLLCYKLSGLPMAETIDEEALRLFAKGSSPKEWGETPDVAVWYPRLTEYAEKLASDHEAGLFQEFTPYKTSAGVELNSIEDAIVFNNFHEGIHLGYAMALRKATKPAG